MHSQSALQKQSMLLRPTISTSVLVFADQASRGGKSSGRTARPQCKDAVGTVWNNRSRAALSKIRCCPQILFLTLSVLLALHVVWYRCSPFLTPHGPKTSPSLHFLVCHVDSTTVGSALLILREVLVVLKSAAARKTMRTSLRMRSIVLGALRTMVESKCVA